LKANSGWSNDGNGSNKSGFSGLPNGHCGIDGLFYDMDTHCDIWSSSGDFKASYIGLDFDRKSVYRNREEMGAGLAVRCFRDND